jgi:hypothetical protein
MNFKSQFLAALLAGQDYDSLLELVRRHESQGLSPEAAYEVLQQIWLEHGFDEKRDDTSFQGNLEAVMEKVWYESPA